MKTILVLTDFSINADYVAQYALRMAQEIGANILLCNIYQVPKGEETTDRKYWPMRDCEENSINDLGARVAMLKGRLDEQVSGNGFRPDIEQYSKEGLLSDILKELADTRDILLAIISKHGVNNITEYFDTNHTWKVVDKATFPVMVIPYQARYKPFNLIAFATVMNYTDITILESVTGLANYSSAEVVITNVTKEEKGENMVKRFFNQIPSKITYPKIVCHNIIESNVVRGLNKLCAHIDIDLLVLVHHRHTFLQTLFGANVTRRMIDNPRKPLLIFPGSTVKETLTIF